MQRVHTRYIAKGTESGNAFTLLCSGPFSIIEAEVLPQLPTNNCFMASGTNQVIKFYKHSLPPTCQRIMHIFIVLTDIHGVKKMAGRNYVYVFVSHSNGQRHTPTFLAEGCDLSHMSQIRLSFASSWFWYWRMDDDSSWSSVEQHLLLTVMAALQESYCTIICQSQAAISQQIPFVETFRAFPHPITSQHSNTHKGCIYSVFPP